MMANSSFKKAKVKKNDEFYTQSVDIENELVHYRAHFKDKVVFCNCDDPEESNFWWFFKMNFDFLGIKKLITTHYHSHKPTYKLVIDGTKRTKDGIPREVKTQLKENGDFRSDEAVSILKQADVVVTNPPFSLFRDYVAQLMKYDKKFLIIGNQNALTYSDIFPLLRDNRIWLGVSSGSMAFRVPNDYVAKSVYEDEAGNKWQKLGNITWYTNLPHKKRYEDIILIKKYYGNEKSYPKYVNFDAIEVNKVKDIPYDYEGVMGVPITFMNKYNPEQFDIIGMSQGLLFRSICDTGLSQKFVDDYYADGGKGAIRANHPTVGFYNEDGRAVIPYDRVFIKHKRGVHNED